jgi:hypothetical protein
LIFFYTYTVFTASYGVQLSDEELASQHVLKDEKHVSQHFLTDEELVSQHVLGDYFTSVHTPALGMVWGEEGEGGGEDIIPIHVIDFNLC